MSKTIEETYQKKTQKEHILLRPDTYIGAIDMDTQHMYVWDGDKNQIVNKSISYVPGLYKIFDEILVNAADNKMRDPKMNTLRVNISKELNTISIYNNGKGIPIEIHKEEKVYVPELIFGHLLTGSNYDDEERKVTGGRNGYGAKLCNIFSTEFIVETGDKKRQKKYYQKFSRNMDVINPPVIEKYTDEEFTRITFKPDLKRFKMPELEDNIISLLKKRVYDMCGTLKNVKVFLNDILLEVTDFKDYVKLYLGDSDEIVHSVINPRWEVAFAISEDQFSQVSFVNSISTSKGGTHVAHLLDRIMEPITSAIKKKDKALDVKPLHIKNSMFVFINCLIENPAFDSQTKENLTLKASSFGSKCEPTDKFVKAIIEKTPLISRIVEFSRVKQSMQLKKTDGSKTTRLSGIKKLDDANFAGGKKSSECTLILTEGDSAKTLAVSGLSVVGRDLYGVFPLRGKLLNVREANHKQIMDNEEICNIKKILGLQHGKVYKNNTELRYGHVMIMTDQDYDGSHIKGLIINFFDHFFPSLLKVPNFLLEFITPIVRAKKGKESIDFFTIPEVETFKQSHTGWTYKYYKGLGTSTAEDARMYFSDLKKHVKSFDIIEENDRSLIDLAFNKKKADMRKSWLGEFIPGTFLGSNEAKISISDFINKEFILFSMADNIRSIPSVIDGFKPGQRKVLFCCFKKNLVTEIKVAQLIGYISEKSAYHHGEQSLASTIVNMAQNFVGSNNLNLLLPIGQFGTRLMGGQDAASARYINTALNPITRLIFSALDDPILNYLQEDNLSIEPEYYIPIIPMVLVNGADGIGTGWSTNIPNFNPLDIIKNIRKLINGEEPVEMKPYYRNFKGDIDKTEDGKFLISGIINEFDSGELEVLELPIGVWTNTYKEYLDSLIGESVVKDFKEYHTDKKVNFLINYNKPFATKITKTLTTTNMVCFDADGRIKKYSNEIEILKDFYITRLKFYTIRKEQRLAFIKGELKILENKVRFIKDVVNDILIIRKRSTDVIEADMVRMGYDKVEDSFDYLLDMKISSLTIERINKLNQEKYNKENEYRTLLGKTIYNLWNEDLDNFEVEYLKLLKKEEAEYESDGPKSNKKSKPKSRFVDKFSEKSSTTLSKKVKSSDNNKKTVNSSKKGDAKTAKKNIGEPKLAVKSNLGSSKKGDTKTDKKSIDESKLEAKSKVSESEMALKKPKLSVKPKERLSVFIESSSDSDKPWNKYK